MKNKFILSTIFLFFTGSVIADSVLSSEKFNTITSEAAQKAVKNAAPLFNKMFENAAQEAAKKTGDELLQRPWWDWGFSFSTKNMFDSMSSHPLWWIGGICTSFYLYFSTYRGWCNSQAIPRQHLMTYILDDKSRSFNLTKNQASAKKEAAKIDLIPFVKDRTLIDLVNQFYSATDNTVLKNLGNKIISRLHGSCLI